MDSKEINESVTKIGSHSLDLWLSPDLLTSSSRYKVKYRPVHSQNKFTTLLTNKPYASLDNLSSDTTYEINVYIEDNEGEEHHVFKTQGKTEESKAEYLKSRGKKDHANGFVYNLSPTTPESYDNHVIERQFCFDTNGDRPTQKTALLLGGVGSGKTTTVNALANYFLGIDYADNFRISITSDEIKIDSIAVCYKITPQKSPRWKWTLNIVDVRSFAPHAKDDYCLRTVKSLNTFIRKLNDDHICCLVIDTSCRLTAPIRASLENIRCALREMKEERVVPLFTFYDGGDVTCHILQEANISYQENFRLLVNNANLFENGGEPVDVWRTRNESFQRLLDYLEGKMIICTDTIPKKTLSAAKEAICYTNSTSNSVTVNWTGGNANYKIKFKKGSGDWRVRSTTAPSITLENLKRGTSYEIKIFLEKDDGTECFLCKVEEKTKMSNASQYIKFAVKSSADGFVHQLVPSKKEYIGDLHNVDVREYLINVSHALRAERTIVLFGGPKSGKKTLVDAMVNYIFGVDYTDDFRFRVSDTADKTSSDNRKITLHQIVPPRESKLPFKLNSIYVPGIMCEEGQTNTDIISDLGILLESGKIRYINFACIVVPSTCRLTKDYRDIFKTITSLLGKDVSFLTPLITFHDGGSDNVLTALKEYGIPYFDHSYYRFNNADVFKTNETFESWKARNEVMKDVFQNISSTAEMSIETTKKVLKSLKKIEKFSQEEKKLRTKVDKLMPIQKLNDSREDSGIKIPEQGKHKKHSENWHINCTVCETTCRSNCSWVWRWFWCFFMLLEAICCRLFCQFLCIICSTYLKCKNLLNCACKCRLGNHVNEKFRYVDHNIPSGTNLQDKSTEDAINEYKVLLGQVQDEHAVLQENALRCNNKLLENMKLYIENL